MKNTLHVLLKTTSEMHCAYPNNGVKDNGALINKTLKKQVGKHQVPYFASNGFRGAFRRYISDLIEAQFVETKQQISKNLYLGLRCGSAEAAPDKADNSIEELVRASNHAYMGLFGGGPRVMQSRYAVSDLMPIIKHTVDTNAVAVPDELVKDILISQERTTDEGVKILEPYQTYSTERFITKVDDLIRNADVNSINSVVSGGVDSIKVHAEAISENKKSRKADEATKKIDVSNLIEVETIRSGVDMHFRLDFHPDVTEEQLGMALLAVQSMANENYLGGMGRNGLGRFNITHMQLTYEDEIIHCEGLYNEHEELVLNKEFEKFSNKAKSAITKMSVEELEDFFDKKEK